MRPQHERKLPAADGVVRVLDDQIDHTSHGIRQSDLLSNTETLVSIL